MMNDDALFTAQVDSADKTLDEVLVGSVFVEDVPAGAAAAIKQPAECFTAAAAELWLLSSRNTLCRGGRQ